MKLECKNRKVKWINKLYHENFTINIIEFTLLLIVIFFDFIYEVIVHNKILTNSLSLFNLFNIPEKFY